MAYLRPQLDILLNRRILITYCLVTTRSYMFKPQLAYC